MTVTFDWQVVTTQNHMKRVSMGDCLLQFGLCVSLRDGLDCLNCFEKTQPTVGGTIPEAGVWNSTSGQLDQNISKQAHEHVHSFPFLSVDVVWEPVFHQVRSPWASSLNFYWSSILLGIVKVSQPGGPSLHLITESLGQHIAKILWILNSSLLNYETVLWPKATQMKRGYVLFWRTCWEIRRNLSENLFFLNKIKLHFFVCVTQISLWTRELTMLPLLASNWQSNCLRFQSANLLTVRLHAAWRPLSSRWSLPNLCSLFHHFRSFLSKETW